MNLDEYNDQDGFRVWLSQSELQTLLNQTTTTQREIAYRLGARCGLRSKEVTNVAPEHVHQTDAGTMLRVWNSKGKELRETPVPDKLRTQIETIDDVRDETASQPVVDVSTRTLRRWLRQDCDELANTDEHDDGWQYVGFHDLRRTWAGHMNSADVAATLVCEWGGWNDIDIFLDHYKGIMTPEGQLREREKVDWL